MMVKLHLFADMRQDVLDIHWFYKMTLNKGVNRNVATTAIA